MPPISVASSRGEMPSSNQPAMCGLTLSVTKDRTVFWMIRSSSSRRASRLSRLVTSTGMTWFSSRVGQ